ncbi:MAG TPA: hypothetical protein DGU45_10920, partial [Planctomycetes bacterium]|nr:hypothetical protein [Planctomycetota bacterium]
MVKPWIPTTEIVDTSNIVRWMRDLGHEVDAENPTVAVNNFIRWSQESSADFWDALMLDLGVVWTQGYEQTLDLSKGPEWADWFVGGRTSIALNCVDLPASENPDDLALVGESEDGTVRRWTFSEVADHVDQLAGLLRSRGIRPGDRIG